MVRELVRLDEIHRTFGPLTILEGVNLRIDEGDRIGVVGHNGAGKTTLLRTISNQDQDMGDITFAPGLRLAFLTQIRDLDEDATLGAELNRRGRQFQELVDEITPYFETAVKQGMFAEDGGGLPAALGDFDFLVASGGLKGPASNLNPDNFWNFELC